MAFTLILIPLLALNGCGGSGGDHDDDDDDGSSSSNIAPAVPGCDGEIFIEASVEASGTNTQSLTLLGLTVRIDDRTRFNNVHLADLAVGDFVDMRGFVAADGDVVATCLEREASRDEVELWGPVDADGIAEPRLFILDVEIQTGLHTVFEDGRLTQAAFFAQVQPDDLVEVEGQLQASMAACALRKLNLKIAVVFLAVTTMTTVLLTMMTTMAPSAVMTMMTTGTMMTTTDNLIWPTEHQIEDAIEMKGT